MTLSAGSGSAHLAPLPERILKLSDLNLSEGSHDSFDRGVCVMEAVAWVAGEEHSDDPSCACPIISTFLRGWNDSLRSDEDRNRLLRPLVPKLVGTRSTREVENRRATMAADWFVRIYTPAWLRIAGLNDVADALSAFPEITDFASVPGLRPALEAAQKSSAAAWDAASAAASAAARAAAYAAAWDAAWAAARDAARDAARAAARAAAYAAAWDAAWAAARDAAWAAAYKKLEPTLRELQTSAVALVERMIEVRAA